MRFSLSSVFRSVFVLAICLFWVYLGVGRAPEGIFTITMVPLGLILAATRTYRISSSPFKSIVTFCLFLVAWLLLVGYAEILMLACFPPLSVASEERLSLDLDIFVLRSIAVVFFAPALYVFWLLYVNWIRSVNCSGVFRRL